MSNYEIFHRLLNQFHAHRLTSFQFRLISSTFLEKYKHIEQASKRLFCFYFLYFTDCGFELSFLLFASLFDMIIWVALIMMPLNASWDADLCRKFERVSLCQRTTGNVNQSLLIKENQFNQQIRENFTNYPLPLRQDIFIYATLNSVHRLIYSNHRLKTRRYFDRFLLRSRFWTDNFTLLTRTHINFYCVIDLNTFLCLGDESKWVFFLES